MAHTDQVSRSRLLQGLLHLVEARVLLDLLRYEVHGALPVVEVVALPLEGVLPLVFGAAGVHSHVLQPELAFIAVMDLPLASYPFLRLGVLWVLLLAGPGRGQSGLVLLGIAFVLLHKHNGGLQLPLSLPRLLSGVVSARLVLGIRRLPLLLVVFLVLAVIVQVRIGSMIELLSHPFRVCVQLFCGAQPLGLNLHGFSLSGFGLAVIFSQAGTDVVEILRVPA